MLKLWRWRGRLPSGLVMARGASSYEGHRERCDEACKIVLECCRYIPKYHLLPQKKPSASRVK